MKELIDKLSLGIIEYQGPKMTVDTSEIIVSLEPFEQQEGHFLISNQGKGKLKGVLYSSNQHLKLKTTVFSGDKTMIRYSVDARYLKEGSTKNATIHIVSNGGEEEILVQMIVGEISANTSIGKIKNLFQFADLAQQHYEEALRLFCSERFSKIFLREDYALQAKYQALIPGADKNIAMEEFLIVAHKKKAQVKNTVQETTEERNEHPEKKLQNGNYLRYKKKFVRLYQCYLEFRMKQITLEDWQEETLQIISEMSRLAEDKVFVRLLQAQIMIIQEKEVESGLLLQEAERHFDGNFQKDMLLYCYYLYVRALKEKDENYTKKAIKTIKEYYEKENDKWQLLWILMYLDDSYDRNESLKMIRMKEQYDKGMRSPLMYYETLLVLNETPSLLRVLDDYEKQVILFGIKHVCISDKLKDRILDLCTLGRSFDKKIFHILVGLYQFFEDTKILVEIVSMLIKSARTEKEYFVWYEKAVDENLKLTGLYEYYMYTIPFDYEGQIPDIISMYFVYNLTLKGERLDFLYKKVIEYKDEAENIYKLYHHIIVKYAQECILNGRINDKLAVIYQEVLKDAVPAEEYLEKLPDILSTHMVLCDDVNMREVIVVHKETEQEQKVPLICGKAYVKIYSEDVALVFEDVYGNRYIKSVNYRIKKLFVKEEWMELCYEAHSDQLGLMIYLGDGYFKYRKYTQKAVEVMEKLVKVSDIREEYRYFLEDQMMEYYAGNSDEKEFRRYLEEMDAEKMLLTSRWKLMKLSLLRGLYSRSFSLLCAYGCEEIDAKLVFKCVDKMIEQTGEKEDERLIYFAVEAFRNGKYNENTLQYMSRYYYGPTKEMYQIWKATKNFACESREMEEKIIVQMLFTKEYGNHIGTIFESYIGNGASCKVKQAYLFCKAYDYFVRETVIEERIFEHIERELLNKEEVHYLCELAWLKYHATENDLKESQILLARKILYKMCDRNKKYEFYKQYRKYFALPDMIEDKTILEYRTNPENTVWVHYLLEGSEEEYCKEEMINSCYGIFTCEFILFYGEKIKYYITEENKEEMNTPESMELTIGQQHTWSEDSPYGILNNMMVCREMQEEKTLNDLMTDYYVKNKLNESIFMTT